MPLRKPGPVPAAFRLLNTSIGVNISSVPSAGSPFAGSAWLSKTKTALGLVEKQPTVIVAARLLTKN